MHPSGPGLFLVDRLVIAASISDLIIGLFRDLSSSWFSLGCKCPGMYLFLLDFLVYLHRVFVVFSDGSLYFCEIGGDIFFIIFYCIYLILLSFLLY